MQIPMLKMTLFLLLTRGRDTEEERNNIPLEFFVFTIKLMWFRVNEFFKEFVSGFNLKQSRMVHSCFF